MSTTGIAHGGKRPGKSIAGPCEAVDEGHRQRRDGLASRLPVLHLGPSVLAGAGPSPLFSPYELEHSVCILHAISCQLHPSLGHCMLLRQVHGLSPLAHPAVFRPLAH